MSVYRFAGFRFDCARLALYQQRQRCELRPKAAALLKCLITRRGCIVGKQDIARSVWQSEFVTDQCLFQTMSELRKALLPLAPIQTHPNLGYEWVEPVSTAHAQPRHTVAAVLLVAITATTLLVGSARNAATPAAAGTVAMAGFAPTLMAFSSGMTSLQGNDLDAAARFFQLALRENPGFIEARLMLAEALLAQGQAAAATAHAKAIVDQSDARRDPYMAVAAMALLSRAEDAAGRHSSALEWIGTAMHEAREEGFACAVLGLERRRVALMSPLDRAATAPPAPATVPQVPPYAAAEALERCAQMQGIGPQARLASPLPAGPFDRCAAPARKTDDYSIA